MLSDPTAGVRIGAADCERMTESCLSLQRRLVLRELYPSKEALDAAGTGAAEVMSETFGQLDELLVTVAASAGRA